MSKPSAAPEGAVKDARSFTTEDVNRIVEERLARDRQERREQARTDARVVAEPRVYALDSPHSYFLDAAHTQLDPSGLMYPEARQRMNRYAGELAHEMERRSAEGQRAERVIRDCWKRRSWLRASSSRMLSRMTRSARCPSAERRSI